jgi:hypothetical protein
MRSPETEMAAVLEEVHRRAAEARRTQEERGPVVSESVPTALARLEEAVDLFAVEFRTDRAVGRLVIPLKRLLRRLLTPILARQAAYNAANASLVRMLAEDLEREIGLLRAEIRRLGLELGARLETLERVASELRERSTR